MIIIRLLSLLTIIAVVFFVASQIILPALRGRPLFPLFRKDYRDAVEDVEEVKESLDVSRMREETVKIATDEILGRVRSIEEAQRRLSEIDQHENENEEEDK